MNHLVLSLFVQLSLAFGVAGLLWPEKLVAVFDVLMFPLACNPQIGAGQRLGRCRTFSPAVPHVDIAALVARPA